MAREADVHIPVVTWYDLADALRRAAPDIFAHIANQYIFVVYCIVFLTTGRANSHELWPLQISQFN